MREHVVPIRCKNRRPNRGVARCQTKKRVEAGTGECADVPLAARRSPLAFLIQICGKRGREQLRQMAGEGYGLVVLLRGDDLDSRTAVIYEAIDEIVVPLEKPDATAKQIRTRRGESVLMRP